MDSSFLELTILLALAAAMGFVGMLLRQPMVVAFIAVGIVAGPSGLDMVQSGENVELLAQLGIAVLLFLVGLKLDLNLIRNSGSVALATGLGQVAFTALIGFGIGLAFGLEPVAALYVAVALTFSSTIIIVKLLSDKREVDSLHGRIAIGFLIVQDLVVVLAMMILSAVGIESEGDGGAGDIGQVLLNGLLALVFVALFIRYLATPLTRRLARSSELLVTFVIGWAALAAALGEELGFSMELGGLLAGITLASTPFREAIIARLASLRDFLLLFFFIALGARLDLNLLGEQVLPALVFSLFVLVGNPLIVMAIMGFMGYRKRSGFLAGLTVAQISEFSLIFMAMGISLGHVDERALGLVTLVGLITIALSVYMITYSHTLYHYLENWLTVFERRRPHREEAADDRALEESRYDVVLFGLGRYGSAIARRLRESGLRILGVDFNPQEVRHWRMQGWDATFGDASDQELLSELPLESVEWVICALPQHDLGIIREDPRIALMDGLRFNHYQGKVAVTTHRPDELRTLQMRGADLVLAPFQDAAEQAVDRIMAAGRTNDNRKLMKEDT